MRVASDKPCRNGGWFHPVGAAPVSRPVRRQLEQIVTQDFAGLLASWPKDGLTAFAATLGVTTEALQALGTVQRDPDTLAFPMFNGAGEIVGIRLRSNDGRKFAVRGSKQGLFIPCHLLDQSNRESNSELQAHERNPMGKIDTMFLVEGPTDLAAALIIGLENCVGRPSCCGGTEHLKVLLRRLTFRRVVLLADNDAPGIQGAERLASEIGLPSALVVLPAKDLREFVHMGGTRQMVEMILHDTIWRTGRSGGNEL